MHLFSGQENNRSFAPNVFAQQRNGTRNFYFSPALLLPVFAASGRKPQTSLKKEAPSSTHSKNDTALGARARKVYTAIGTTLYILESS